MALKEEDDPLYLLQ